VYLIPALEGTSTVFPPPPAATAFLDKPLIGVVTLSESVTEKLKHLMLLLPQMQIMISSVLMLPY